jgi:hypothetical protein
MSLTFLMAVTISLRVWPDCSTSLPPSSTLATLSVISALISLAASALRWASLRTSPATTAKPRPCSPARAASTAAFSASRLVWKAISSITPMMSAILRLLWWMALIAVTAVDHLAALLGLVRAALASWLACPAFSALCLTVEVSSSIEEAVSSRRRGLLFGALRQVGAALGDLGGGRTDLGGGLRDLAHHVFQLGGHGVHGAGQIADLISAGRQIGGHLSAHVALGQHAQNLAAPPERNRHAPGDQPAEERGKHDTHPRGRDGP